MCVLHYHFIIVLFVLVQLKNNTQLKKCQQKRIVNYYYRKDLHIYISIYSDYLHFLLLKQNKCYNNYINNRGGTMNKINNKILIFGNLVAISLSVTSTGIQTYLIENKKVTYENIESRINYSEENTENVVAYINETPYLTLKEAITAANTTGGTIKLANDITFNEA